MTYLTIGEKINAFMSEVMTAIINQTIGNVYASIEPDKNIYLEVSKRLYYNVDNGLFRIATGIAIEELSESSNTYNVQKIKNISPQSLELATRVLVFESKEQQLKFLNEKIDNLEVDSLKRKGLEADRKILVENIQKLNENFQHSLPEGHHLKGKSPQEIAQAIFGKSAADVWAKKLGNGFALKEAFDLLIQARENNFSQMTEEEIRDYTKDWAVLAVGTIDNFVAIENGGVYNYIANKLKYHISSKQLLGAMTRGVVIGIMTELAYKAGYYVGKLLFEDVYEYVFGETLYEADWYINSSEKVFSYLLNDLNKDEYNTASAVSRLILDNFRNTSDQNSPNRFLQSSVLGSLFGDTEIKEMNFQKVIKVYQKLYYLLSGSDDAKNIKDAESLTEHMKTHDVYHLFRSKKGTVLKVIGDSEKDLQEFLERIESKDDFAARYALKYMNPFIIENQDLYKKDELDSLQLFDFKTAPNGMTEKYIEKHFEMYSLLAKNNFDFNGLVVNTSGNVYVDYTSNTTIISSLPKAVVLFGTDGNEKLDATLYVIDRNNDYSQTSYIFAGDGEDTLIGTRGNDYLEGGIGVDTYHIKGNDAVFDADLKGKIIFAGQDENIFFHFVKKEKTSDEFIDINHPEITAKIEGDSLIIKKGDESAKIENFFTLAPLENHIAKGLNIILNDLSIEENTGNYQLKQNGSGDYRNHFYTSGYSAELIGGSKEDIIFGRGDGAIKAMLLGGNDRFLGSSKADIVFGGDGDDYLLGMSGAIDANNLKQYEDDRDYLVGGKGRDLIAGRAGDDILIADVENAHQSTVTQDAFGDWIVGQQGNDTIYGANTHDFLNGGEGKDTIFGGAGNDLILGDGNVWFEIRSQQTRSTDYTIEWRKDYSSQEPNLISGKIPYKNFIDKKSFDWTFEINEATGEYRIIPALEYKGQAFFKEETYKVENDGQGDFLYGGAGNDLIIGQDGDDTLEGNSGNDILIGDDHNHLELRGNDTLRGGEGNDKLYAGKGNDYLAGGRDSDSYYFNKDDLTYDDINTIDDEGKSDSIYLDGKKLSEYQWTKNKENQWSSDYGYQITLEENTLIIKHQNKLGIIKVIDFENGDYGFLTNGTINHAPQIEHKVGNITGNNKEILNYTFGENLFSDPDGDTLIYQVTGLPEGLTFDSATKTLTGIVTQAGNYNFTLIARDKDGEEASQTIKLTIEEKNSPPEVTKQVENLTGNSNEPFSYTFAEDLFIDPDGDKLTYSINMNTIPLGLSFDSTTNTLSGNPQKAGDYTFDLIASDGKGGKVSQSVNLSITYVNHAPEVKHPLDSYTITLREKWQQTIKEDTVIDPDGDKLTYSLAENAPTWLTIDPNNGTLSGTPTESGTVQTKVIVSDLEGQNIALDLNLIVEKPENITLKNGINFNSLGDDIVYGSEEKDIFFGMSGNDQLFGWGGDDQLNGGLGDDILDGGIGNDQLNGGLGNDILIGGKGNDSLSGGLGNDTYKFNKGDGIDTINDIGGNDVLVMTDFRLEDLKFILEENDLVITTNNSEDKIIIKDWNHFFGHKKIENIELKDYTLTSNQVEQYMTNSKAFLSYLESLNKSESMIL